MSDKILTISVAAYNVDKYLNETLSSLVVKEILDDIEVIVVDDGGSDNSYNIAKEYENQYPNTFKAVHKENGGYGSTINYSIECAKGKYFKLLDGDDYFDKEGFARLVKTLKTLDVDAVLTQFAIEKQNKKTIAISFDKNNVGKIINIEDFKFNAAVPMHSITYKTEILRRATLNLPEHMLYTDNIYISKPFMYVSNIFCENYIVYCYRIGVFGQSVNQNSLIKHIDESKNISILLTKFYEEIKYSNIKSLDYIEMNVAATCVNCVVGILAMPLSNEALLMLKNFDNEVKGISQKIYNRMVALDRKASFALKIIRLTNYISYCFFGLKNIFISN